VNLLRLILLPIALLFGVIVYFRNKFFDWGWIPAYSYSMPIICVGNLSVGGTGKTPHVEYLLRFLQDDFNLAVLSRGYKRKSSGFVLAKEGVVVDQIGDEPYQFYSKFPGIKVAVDENRVSGINILRSKFTELDAIILDDAFQHRYVKPGLSILLTDYHRLYVKDYPMPTGSLREFRSGANRADIIIVTKTSKILSPIVIRDLEEQLKPKVHQKMYYSYIDHGDFTAISGVNFLPDKEKYNKILLVSGIANSYPLEVHLGNHCDELETLYFPDHHQYNTKDIQNILTVFDRILSNNKIIVTTEKDAMRFQHPEIFKLIKEIPICFVPIKIKFHGDGEKDFKKQILNYVKKN
jgi:tetraacyldisaccharide 4'-kinase